MLFAVVIFFLFIIFMGVMAHISKATKVGCGYVTFYTIGWLISLVCLCINWSGLHGFWNVFGAIFSAFIAPFVVHGAGILLKNFVVWALKGFSE